MSVFEVIYLDTPMWVLFACYGVIILVILLTAGYAKLESFIDFIEKSTRRFL